MKKLYIFPNLTEDRYIAKVKKALSALKDKSYHCILEKDDSLKLYGILPEGNEGIKDCDLIVTLGGDGTFLRGGKLAVEYDKPICGINCGDLGYLCACNLKEIDDVNLEELKERKLSLLEFEYDGRMYYAVNEVIVGKDYFGGAIQLEFAVNDHEYFFKGDGLIVTTATGSTGYNLSAGGRQFKERSSRIGITPICPHDRNIKAFLTKRENIIKIRLRNPKYTAGVYADGMHIGQLDSLTVRNSKKKITVLKKDI